MLENGTKYFKLLTRAACVFWISSASSEVLAFADTTSAGNVDSNGAAASDSRAENNAASKAALAPDSTAAPHLDAKTAPPESKDANMSARKTSHLEILFGGSLCPVCLIAFQRRLTGTAGVISATVESLNVERAEQSGHPPKRARAIIEFAPDKITKSELETIVRQNDFQFIKAQELHATNP
jgi:hypothetical protein